MYAFLYRLQVRKKLAKNGWNGLKTRFCSIKVVKTTNNGVEMCVE